MVEPEYKYKPIEWQSFAIGIFAGFILTLILTWYINKDNHPADWCSNLPKLEANYCLDLYWKSVDYQKKFYEKYGEPPGSQDTSM